MPQVPSISVPLQVPSPGGGVQTNQQWFSYWSRLSTSTTVIAGPEGKPGPPGPSGGSASSAAAFTITVAIGVAQPDLSQSPVQHVVLSATTNLAVPANRPVGQIMLWLLYIDNPSGSPWAMIPDGTYLTSSAIIVAAGTRTILTCSTTQGGNTAVTNKLDNQPIASI